MKFQNVIARFAKFGFKPDPLDPMDPLDPLGPVSDCPPLLEHVVFTARHKKVRVLNYNFGCRIELFSMVRDGFVKVNTIGTMSPAINHLVYQVIRLTSSCSVERWLTPGGKDRSELHYRVDFYQTRFVLGAEHKEGINLFEAALLDESVYPVLMDWLKEQGMVNH